MLRDYLRRFASGARKALTRTTKAPEQKPGAKTRKFAIPRPDGTVEIVEQEVHVVAIRHRDGSIEMREMTRNELLRFTSPWGWY